jgi:hypothetical protein
MYEIAARFPGAGTSTDVACCFDPRVVIARLRDEFAGEVEIDPTDHGWRDFKNFVRMGNAEGAARIAENDALRRAPNYVFRFHLPEGQEIGGNAERYVVRVTSDTPIPEPLKTRFLRFLRALPLVPFEVESVRIEGNDHFDA